jgi:hypothetical protein
MAGRPDAIQNVAAGICSSFDRSADTVAGEGLVGMDGMVQSS